MIKKQNLDRIIHPVVLSLLTVAVIICFLYIYLSIKSLSSDNSSRQEDPAEARSKSILITGTSENEDYLRQIYNGALENGGFYDTAIQLYVPASRAENTSLQTLLNYAGFVNSDCVIAYIGSDIETIEPPLRSDGTYIPLITVGIYKPELPQVSFIGVNYSELGKIFASEILSFLKRKGTVFMLNTSATNDLNYSNLMTSMLSYLRQEEKIKVITSPVLSNSSFALQDSMRQQIVSTPDFDVLVTLSEESTILAAQTIIDLNLSGKVELIGFGEGSGSQSYYDKGIISELISIDSANIGKKALVEFQEYSSKGSANNFVMADVKVQRNGGR